MPKAKPESECVSSILIFLFSNHACFVNFVATQAQSMKRSCVVILVVLIDMILEASLHSHVWTIACPLPICSKHAIRWCVYYFLFLLC